MRRCRSRIQSNSVEIPKSGSCHGAHVIRQPLSWSINELVNTCPGLHLSLLAYTCYEKELITYQAVLE